MNVFVLLKKLRNGETVICNACGKGVYRPVGETDSRTTHGFECDKCGEKINID